MFKHNRTRIFVPLIIATTISQNALAQSHNDLPAFNEETSEQPFKKTRIKRDVKPIPYWVDSPSLRLRDNPVAGKIVGKLDFGHKVLAYAQYENWIRISKPEAKQKWINSDFLSNSQISWASYNRSSQTLLPDVRSIRIKDPEDRKNRIFGVRLKTSETGNALITTRQSSELGYFFQNRFVSCKQQQPVGVRLIGEGNDFLGAQNDVRNLNMDIYSINQIDKKADDSAEEAIAKFACNTQPF